jgi:polygalacturonase
MATVDVKSLGASGDGVIDDTAAFNKALRSAKDGKLFVPAGASDRYQTPRSNWTTMRFSWSPRMRRKSTS